MLWKQFFYACKVMGGGAELRRANRATPLCADWNDLRLHSLFSDIIMDEIDKGGAAAAAGQYNGEYVSQLKSLAVELVNGGERPIQGEEGKSDTPVGTEDVEAEACKIDNGEGQNVDAEQDPLNVHAGTSMVGPQLMDDYVGSLMKSKGIDDDQILGDELVLVNNTQAYTLSTDIQQLARDVLAMVEVLGINKNNDENADDGLRNPLDRQHAIDLLESVEDEDGGMRNLPNGQPATGKMYSWSLMQRSAR
ncbi:hypothetical protein MLD38_037968 [Melastoma candidum]|uniref:Uncharacterized protein n=1 Tax=Melastoma candidum TaxID=119954 RepID=A0ACB9KXQ3_9MYRT|nr:hypothetical protein MLD38_037968 [Melastoma candidum]